MFGIQASQVWLTSGGTEADALALAVLVSAAPSRLVVSTIEHAAVAKGACALGVPVERVQVGRSGRVVPDDLLPLVSGAAVSIVAASNETGAIQPVSSIAVVCHAHGALLHTDAVQLPGRTAVDVRALGADLVTFSSHKVGAPGGVGCVAARQGLAPPAGWPSTANVAGALAFAHALELLPSPTEQATLADNRDALEQAILAAVPGSWVVAPGARLANTSCLAFDGASGEAILMALDVRGIAVSTGSACASGSISASPILLGMGLTEREANTTIRFSLPRPLSTSERERVVRDVREVVSRLRSNGS